MTRVAAVTTRLWAPMRAMRPVYRAVIAVVAVVAVVLGVTAASSAGGGGTKHVTAWFTRTIGVYQGNDVRILGVKVGKVDKLTVRGTYVEVKMSYDGKYKLPADVDAVIVPPSVVSDRYIQLTPVYTGGPVLENHALLTTQRTQVPLEFDEIFKNLDKLNNALGPKGANASGALSRLIEVSAQNLSGNGEVLNGALKEFSGAISTLAGSRTNLFDTVTQLQQFTTMLAQNDGGVRALNLNLQKVGAQLAGERHDLGAALANLSTALQLVNSFVADNRTRLTSDIHKLTSVTNVLSREKEAITEVIDMAPFALSNLSLAYDPKAKTLDTLDAAGQPFSAPTATNGVLCTLFKICTAGQPITAPTSYVTHARSLADLLTVKP
jgi:phospholipid/cholesterol/gamma-HCH transport system substrate-binding protein